MVEEVLDGAIDAAFREGTPGELKRLRLAARIALAEGLELITHDPGSNRNHCACESPKPTRSRW